MESKCWEGVSRFRIGCMVVGRWVREPIGLLMLTAVMLLLLLVPQMADMMAGMTVDTAENGAEQLDYWGAAFSLALPVVLLVSMVWYWTRAALEVTAIIRHRRARRHADLSDIKLCRDRWLDDQAPFRLAVFYALILVSMPLISAAFNGGVFSNVLKMISSGAALAAIIPLVVFTRLARAWRPDPQRHPRLWKIRPLALFLAAPGGGLVAVLVMASSGAAVALLAFWPAIIERNFFSLSVALGALAFVLGPLALFQEVFRAIADRVIAEVSQRTRFSFADPERTSRRVGLFALVLCLYGFSFLGEPAQLHVVRTTDTVLAEAPCSAGDKAPCPPLSGQMVRPDIHEAILAWYRARIEAGYPAGRPMPVIIVSAEGGASRSAFWTLAAMRELDRLSAGEFGHFLFGISGVSGGSLGAVTYFQLLRSHPDPKDPLRVNWGENTPADAGLRQLGKADLLAVSIGTYFLNDTLQRLFGTLWAGMPDRAEALEHAFERHWSWKAGAAIPEHLATGGLIAMRNNGPAGLPHLMLNGTDLATGTRVITGTFRFSPEDDVFAASDDLLGILGKDVPASTAVTNSARFPYVSPAGRYIDGKPEHEGKERQILDGGYFENYGSRTAAELARVVNDNSHKLPLVPIVVVLSNDGDAVDTVAEAQAIVDKGNPRPPLIEKAAISCVQARKPEDIALLPVETAKKRSRNNLVGEVLAPVLGLLSTRSAHGQDGLHILRRQLCPPQDSTVAPRMFHLALRRPDPEMGETAPMNWALNPWACQTMACAIQAPFNQGQALAFAGALNGLTGGMARRSSAPLAKFTCDVKCPRESDAQP